MRRYWYRLRERLKRVLLQQSPQARDRYAILAIALVTTVLVSGLMYATYSQVAPWAVSGLQASIAVIAIALISADQQRQRTRQQLAAQRQTEALLNLHSCLELSAPLPTMLDGWSAAPDFLVSVAQAVCNQKPTLIVEASSGVSTLICAYSLRALGHGHVISLEHDGRFAAITEKLLVEHGLEDWATVLASPLVNHRIRGKDYKWYDLQSLHLESPIDMLVIDGPPQYVHPLARYPALPLLHDRMSQHALVLLDDGHRRSERRAVSTWQGEFPNVKSEYLPLERGAFILRVEGKSRCRPIADRIRKESAAPRHQRTLAGRNRPRLSRLASE